MSTATRITRLIATRGTVLAVLLAVLGLAALAGAFSAYADPPVEQVSEQVNHQTVSTQVDTRAVVTGNSSLYAEGETLRNMPVYFHGATPELTLLVNTSVPDGPDVSVSSRIELYFEATRDGELFWDRTRVLQETEERTASGAASARTTVNVTDVRRQIEQRRDEISGVGVFRSVIRVEVSYRTDRYSGTLSASSPIVLTDRAYWLERSISGGRTHSETVTRTVEQDPDPASTLGLAAVGIVSLLGAIGVVLFRRDLDVTAIETAVYRSRYEEWISSGEFPTGTGKKYVRINSLEDLVDTAIDSNKRVVYDEEYDVYAVIDADIVYYFTTDFEQVDAWLDV